MAFQLSPGINVSEIDLTNAVPAVGTSEGAFVGTFRWGPTNERVLISSESQLAARFGKPYISADGTWSNQQSFFSAANFLSYSSTLYVTRTDDSTAAKAGATTFSAKYKGAMGNSLKVIACDDGANSFFDANGAPDSTIALTQGSFSATVTGATPSSGVTTAFDGNSASVVDVSTDTFNISGHGFTTGQPLTYSNEDTADNTNTIGGLSTGQVYYVIVVDDDSFKLSATETGALADTPAVVDLFGLAANSGIGEFTTIASTSTVNGYFESGGYIVIDDDEYEIDSVGSHEPTANTISLNLKNKYWGPTVTGKIYGYQWEGADLFDISPNTGRVHVAVIDSAGLFSGVAGTVLETYGNVSVTDTGAKQFDGSSAYLRDLLELNSDYIEIQTGVEDSTADTSIAGTFTEIFTAGSDGESETLEGFSTGKVMAGWDIYKNPEDVDISLLITGMANPDIQNYVMDNIAESRKDCVAFLSPTKDDDTAQKIVTYAVPLSGSSYSVIDSGYKYQYDKYNDKYAWIPMNGDVAGLCARTDEERDPWFSPAGYNRGQIKNVVKLKLNPNKTQRDLLYKNNINPVIIEPGSGAILFGDKTMQRNPSAFDRINVRRLFIVLEKAIALASKSTLFEFNDEFTRGTFRNMIEPFLRDVQGRRGIYDFKVVCDETNNTGEVIDTNRFIGDIYIKPARSINFIQLNFVAVRTGVEFNEIIGQ
jgi:hypothetical protein